MDIDDREFSLNQLYEARARDFRARDEQLREVGRIIYKVRKIFKDKGENFEDSDAKQLIAEPAEEPDFPIVIFLAAIIKDFLDIPFELSIVGIILTTALSFVLSAVLFVWTLGKMSGGWWKKRIIKWLWIRYVAVFIIEFIPFFKIVPTATIFIYMAYRRETKIVKLFNLALEEFRRAGILKYIK